MTSAIKTLAESEGARSGAAKQESATSDFADPKQQPQHQIDGSVLLPGSGQVVAVKVHHLVPRRHEVLYKRFLRVV